MTAHDTDSSFASDSEKHGDVLDDERTSTPAAEKIDISSEQPAQTRLGLQALDLGDELRLEDDELSVILSMHC